MRRPDDILADAASIVGHGRMRLDDATLDRYAADMTENPPRRPDAVIEVSSRDELVKLVRLAARGGIPLVPRVAGTNIGGLTIPARGGWAVDLTGMNRVLELNREDMVVVIEPGVTFGQLAGILDEEEPRLTTSFPLAPPEASVLANCLLDGLGNLSLRHGTTGEAVSGVEAVLADGSLVRTGVWALGVPVPFSRAPLPDLTGLFLSWQGSTGIVSKLALQVWPRPKTRWRSFVLAQDREAVFRAMHELPRLDVLDDLAALSWPAGKMLLGVARPEERDPAEPEFFLYLDVSACDPRLLAAKRRALSEYFSALKKGGLRFEDPLDVADLVRLEPRFAKFAEFPTRLDFLLDHPGGGLTWVGTYGPMSRFARACAQGIEIVERHGFPPLIVSRAMKGGHFVVLRFIETFDKKDPTDVERVRACNQELCDRLLQEGFVMYKAPGWAVERYRSKLDAGYARLAQDVRRLLDPDGRMNPGRWQL